MLLKEKFVIPIITIAIIIIGKVSIDILIIPNKDQPSIFSTPVIGLIKISSIVQFSYMFLT